MNPLKKIIKNCGYLLIAGILSITSIFVSVSPARENKTGKDTESSDPWQINADNIHFDREQNAYLAEGNVSLTRKGKTLTADRVWLNQTTNNALAEGQVRLISGKDRLTGKRFRLNLKNEIGVLTEGSIFFDKNHIYLSADEIQKTGKNTYVAQNASITTCDGLKPSWRIKSRKMKITLEGYGQAKHASIWTKSVPVFYSPYLVFPVKSKRQSGLLLPKFDASSRLGTQYQQGLFWAINDSSDATLYLHNMTERGVKAGIEYRYVLSEESFGAVKAGGFVDKKVETDSSELDSDSDNLIGYDDDYLRFNKDRYWLRGKFDQQMPHDFTAKLDIDFVSDQDYLHEVRHSLNGFNASQDYFLETFGRDMDEYDDPVRTNSLKLNRTWTSYSLNADLLWYDDVVKRRQQETDDTLHELPAITFAGFRQPITPGLPFYYDLNSEYAYFHRETGTRGHRADVYPRVYYPFYIFKGISVEPSAGARETVWFVDQDVSPESDQAHLNRQMYDFKLNTKTQLYRIFNFTSDGYDKLKHAIEPEIAYEYIPEQNQTQYPEFDEIDSIEEKNLVTLSFTNTLTLRKPYQIGNQAPVHRYTNFLRFEISESFDINAYNDEDDEDHQQPLTDILSELELTPGRYISIDSDSEWSPYDYEFTRHSNTLNFFNNRGDSVSFGYIYDTEPVDSSQNIIDSYTLDGILIVTDRFSMRGGYEFNRYTGDEIETRIGLTYRTQCWALDLDYALEENNTRYGFMIHLLGLASAGGGI
ncbi:MAG: LPS-assembly protein LptD [Desulfobacteraceae bacterium]|nr:LPS-assembly protein LptD [Desulfobacteraceae bacterium]